MAKGGMRCGAGRPGRLAKVEHCRALDVRRLARAEILSPGSWGWEWRDSETNEVKASIGIGGAPDCLTLSFTIGGKSVVQVVAIVRTSSHFGGARPWFLCPSCDRRSAKLHLRFGRFACRQCQRLAYASQSEDELGRMWRKQAKLERRLGPDLVRPKHMHLATYQGIRLAIRDLEWRREDAFVDFMARAGFAG